MSLHKAQASARSTAASLGIMNPFDAECRLEHERHFGGRLLVKAFVAGAVFLRRFAPTLLSRRRQFVRDQTYMAGPCAASGL
jgi:hypothetical protein